MKKNNLLLYLVLLFLGYGVTSSFVLQPEDKGIVNGNTLELKTIVIDAGHGGHDNGTSGAYNKEKAIALDIALKVGNMVEQQMPNVKVLYTRKTDKFVSLKQRAAYANRHNADFFISVHCNGGSKTASGTETFVLGLHRNKDNLQVAMRENNSILLEDDYNQHYGNFNPNSPEAYIIFNLYQDAHLSQSLDLASLIETEFKHTAQRRSRGVKQAGFLVLRETAMPSILVETGFLTNRSEESFMASSNGKDKLARSIFNAFRSYKAKQDQANAHLHAEKIRKQKKEAEDAKVAAEKARRLTESEWAWPVMRDKHLTGEHYFIQLMVSSNYNKGNNDFKGLDKMVIEYIDRGDVYKYSMGPYANFNEAKTAQLNAREKGFRDAFILKYNGNARSK